MTIDVFGICAMQMSNLDALWDGRKVFLYPPLRLINDQGHTTFANLRFSSAGGQVGSVPNRQHITGNLVTADADDDVRQEITGSMAR